MKKILSVSIIVMCVSTNLFAQWSGGLKGGVNMATQKWTLEIDGESDSQKFEGTSFHVGGYLNYAINEAAVFQPELLYNSLSFDLDGEDFTLNYISVPLMLGYGFDANKVILQAGPQVGFLLSSDPSELRDEDFIKGVDFTFAFGAVVNFGKFNLSVRYGAGLTNIATQKFNDMLEEELEATFGPLDLDTSIKNSNLQFSVGYKLFGEGFKAKE